MDDTHLGTFEVGSYEGDAIEEWALCWLPDLGLENSGRNGMSFGNT